MPRTHLLTAVEVANAPPGFHSDGGGLYLQVGITGAKSWIFRFQLAGRRREMGIGSASKLSLKQARAEAAKLQGLLEKKIDPLAQRQEQAADEAAVEAVDRATFKAVASAYITAHRAGWKNAKHADQWANTLETYAYPKLGSKRVSDITTDDVLAVLEQRETHKGPTLWQAKTETASRLRSRIELVLSYAKAKNLRQGENAAAWRGTLKALLPAPTKVRKVRHHPALPFPKMADFMKALRLVPGSGARALEFAILTAARSGEVRLATWDEVDTKAKVWTIPAARMKAKSEHRVPLSPAALAVIKGMPKVAECPYIFYGARDRKPMSDMSLSAVVRRMNKPTVKWTSKLGDPVVPHGFRSSFRDWAAEVTQYPSDLCEMALAHTIDDKTEAAYRRGDMFEKRVTMMADWADWCVPTRKGK